MIEISSTVGFWILNAWRRMNAQLQINRSTPEEAWTLPEGEVEWVAPSLSRARFAVAILEEDATQKREWTESLANARFWFGVVGESDNPEGFTGDGWHGFMRIESPDAKLVIGEICAKPF